jgi:hypothetical protein
MNSIKSWRTVWVLRQAHLLNKLSEVIKLLRIDTKIGNDSNNAAFSPSLLHLISATRRIHLSVYTLV